MKPRRILFPATLALAVSIASISSSRANSYQWDPNGSVTGLGGAGTWDSTSLQWDDMANGANGGVDGTVAVTFTDADEAVFAGVAGTVNLAGNVTLQRIKFDTADYVLAGQTIALAGTAPEIVVNQNATISSVLSGTAAVVKSGTGVLTLSGANSFAGGLKVSAGSLKGTNVGSFGSLATGNVVTVASGASLDIAGVTRSTKMMDLTISGDGLGGGVGALTHSGTGDLFGAATGVTKLTLAADASVGGNGGRFDLGAGPSGVGYTIDGGGHILTKVGTNAIDVRVATITNLAGVNVNGGMWYYEALDMTGTSSQNMTHTVNPGGTLSSHGTRTFNMPVVLNGGTLSSNNSTGTWTGNVQIPVDSTIGATVSGQMVALKGSVSGVGKLTVLGNLTLDYTTNNTNKVGDGGLVLTGGAVRFKGNASADTTQLVNGLTVNGGGSVYVDTAAGRTTTVDFSAVGTQVPTGLYVGTTGTGIAQIRVAGTTANSSVAGVAFNETFAKTDANNYLTGSIKNTTATDLATWVTGETQYTTTGAAFTNEVGADVVIDGITFKDAAARTVTVGAGNVLTLSRGVLTAATVGNNVSTITGGSLQGATGTDLVIYQGNTLNNLTIASTIVDHGGNRLVKSGTGELVLSATANSYSGGTEVQAGKIKASLGTTGGARTVFGTGAITMNAGTTIEFFAGSTGNAMSRTNAFNLLGATLISNDAVQTYSGLISLTNQNTVNVVWSGKNAIFSNIVSGTGGLTKTGDGMLTLNGANTFEGQVNVNAGTLQLGHDSGLGSVAGGTVVNTGGILDLNGKSTNGEPITLSGGTLKNGSTSEPAVNGVVLTRNSSLSTTGFIFLKGVSGEGKLTVNGKFWTNVATSTYSNKGGIELQTGQIDLYGSAQFTSGPLVVKGGVLNTFGAQNIADGLEVIVDGGTWNVSDGEVIGGLTGTGGTVNVKGVGLVTGDGLDRQYLGVIAGVGGLVKQGTGRMTLGGLNTYTGATKVKAGSLVWGVTDAIADASAVVVENATLDVAGFSDTVGALTPTGVATVHVGAGGHLSFADSSAVDWTGASVQVTGTFVAGQSVRFGTSAAGLTADQLAKVVIPSGKAVALDANGYLVEASVPASGYDSWAGSNGYNLTGDAALPTSDPDGDGFSNLQEYLYGSSPVASNGNLVSSAVEGGELVMRWKQRKQGAGYVLKESATMANGSWATSSVVPVLETADVEPGYDAYRVVIPLAADKKFFRVEAAEQPQG